MEIQDKKIVILGYSTLTIKKNYVIIHKIESRFQQRGMKKFAE